MPADGLCCTAQGLLPGAAKQLQQQLKEKELRAAAPHGARLAAGSMCACTQPWLSIMLHHMWLSMVGNRCGVLSNPYGSRLVSLCCRMNYGERREAEAEPARAAGLDILQMNRFLPKS